LADNYRAEHSRRVRAIRADDPSHPHRHVFLRHSDGDASGNQPSIEPESRR
jgi:hypothetical protein